MLRFVLISIVACVGISPAAAIATDDFNVATLLTGLRGPTGIAIRPGGTPERHEIYVSDGRAGRIIRVRSDESEKQTEAIIGFGAADRGLQARPAGLLFLSRNRLVVCFENCPRETCVRLYVLANNGPLTADQAEEQIGIGERNGADAAAPANVYALARTLANDRVVDRLIASSYGPDNHPGLWAIPVRADTLDKPAPFADTRQSTRPSCVATSRQGYVVVARANDDDAGGSQLRFYNPTDGSKVMELDANLEQVVGLAYSPRSGNLYGAAFGPDGSDGVAKASGVYRLEDASQPGEPACRAVKVADVLRPTALAFGPDGALYVTAEDMADADQSLLLRITGEF